MSAHISIEPGKSVTRPPVTVRRGRVLIVDDEVKIAATYQRILVSKGFEVTVAHDGESALATFEKGDFEAVISDLAMPRMNGITLLARLREKNADVPFVLVTAAATTESAMRAVEFGAMRYLLKPVSLRDLAKAAEDAVTAGRAAAFKRRACAVAHSIENEEQELLRRRENLSVAINALYIHYQPIVSFSEQRIFGYEALARTTDSRLSNPEALLEAAEHCERVCDVGRAVRTLVPRDAANVPGNALLFMNLHCKDLEDVTLFDERTQLSRIAERVVLEITERASLEEVSSVHARIAALRAMGFRIALDDIGSGYANLTSFALLEPEIVKLDMSLVRNIHKSTMNQRLVRSLVVLCGDLGAKLIAEGVETTDERDVLLSLGCDLFQGYLFARPGPPFPTWEK